MLISHSHRFIFFHVAKTGGLSVRSALLPYAEEPSHFKIDRPPPMVEGMPNPLYQVWDSLLLHATAADARRYLGSEIFDQYFKFAFVRNPWDWQVSMYHFILREPNHARHELVSSLGSFEKYLDWMMTTPRPFPKGAKKRQLEVIADDSGRVLVDRVGRYESLDEDFDAVCKLLSIDAELPHLNRTRHRDYRSLYHPIYRQKVADYFAEDIAAFGYTWDGFVGER